MARLSAEMAALPISLIDGVCLADLNLPARRPHSTVLGTERGPVMPTLVNALERYLDEAGLRNKG